MAESRAKERWAHTSSVMALIAETNRNPKKRGRPFTPDDFNPFARKRKRKAGTQPDGGQHRRTAGAVAAGETQSTQGRGGSLR